MKTLASAVLLVVLVLGTALPTAAPGQSAEVSGALLRGLDKITARITTFEAPLNQEARFGTLRILAHTCRKRPPEETPEVAVFLEIEEERPGVEGRLTLFTGWMFASSPALSALEHPVYDVWVIDCSTTADDNDLPERLKSRTPDNGPDNASDKRE